MMVTTTQACNRGIVLIKTYLTLSLAMLGASPSLSASYKQVAELLKTTGALKLSKQKKFKLASGEMSDHYFDLRLLCGDPDGIGAVAEALYDEIKPLGIQAVGGLESGSIPIATAISYLSSLESKRDKNTRYKPVSSFFVRKKQKEHGMKNMIEGKFNSPVAVVDDIVTSGRSALKAVDAMRDAEYDCEHLFCVVFRGSEEQRKQIEEKVKMHYLFRADELLSNLKEDPKILV